LKKFATCGCVVALGLLAGCGSSDTKTVTQASTTPPPAAPATTTPSSGDSMGTVPQNMATGGEFDATKEDVLRAIEAKVESAASANGLTHVVAHCTADSPTRATCVVTGTNASGQQGDETDVIAIDQNDGSLTLVSQK
jgi:cytoskeletal protein RodZ